MIDLNLVTIKHSLWIKINSHQINESKVTIIDRRVPFQIKSNQFNLPQLYSNQVVETSQGCSIETGYN